jgi:hypothetical protein
MRGAVITQYKQPLEVQKTLLSETTDYNTLGFSVINHSAAAAA